MKFDPADADKSKYTVPEGYYDFECVKAVNKVSRSGNDMIEVTLRVHYSGESIEVRDWLLGKWPKKLKHFCQQAGLMRQYEAGEVTPEDCVGVGGVCYLVLDEYIGDDHKKYTNSKVDDYGRPSNDEAKSTLPPRAQDDDDLPF